MLSQQIRRQFLEYFKKQQHAVVPSSPVLPHDDPTLLFTNAGMNQFKDVFLGESRRDYTRATTSQKCIRVGGKHNDLDNVGHTKRHLTLFEMLGNFSFGDYFKEDAIKFAWEVSTEVFGFDPDRIWPSIYNDDEEAYELWKQIVPEERITRFGESENFWAMGDTGPCGPCSELFYDRGPDYGDAPTLKADVDETRFFEFWNLVFMQFNRTPEGALEPLPNQSIDTGAGLERIVLLKQGVDNIFQTDVLSHLVQSVQEISGKKYDPENKETAPAYHVIADHLRCLSFAIADGVQPSNLDRGYVLRKVLRRAVRYGRQLGMDKPFLAKVFPALLETMGPDYKELEQAKDRITEILTLEEESFIRTLRRGGNMLNQIIDHARRHGHRISGEDSFKLKDTYGFPIEEVLLIAKDTNLTVDLDRYVELEKEAKERSRSAQKVTEQVAGENLFANFAEEHGATKFCGYDETQGQGKVVALVRDGNFVQNLSEGQEGMVVLSDTPFYAEMGGQVGDTGELTSSQSAFFVRDTQSPFKGVIAHTGILNKGELKVGDALDAAVDRRRRKKIANNHTATHLLHWALHQVLGEHVKQAGSVVDPDRLRFDFSHHKALSDSEIQEIENIINDKIRENQKVEWYELPYADVQKRDDIKQFFGEKYDQTVRVIDIDYSKELCGGTHTDALGNIGLFRIAKEGSIAAGVRRIEAVTGPEAEQLIRHPQQQLQELAALLKTQPQKIMERVDKLLEENKGLQQQLKEIKAQGVKALVNDLVDKAQEINGTPLITADLVLDGDQLRLCADQVMNKWASGVLVLGATDNGRCQLLVRVTDDLIKKGVKANELIKEIAPCIQGGGGGKADSAQAGGKEPKGLPEALAKVKELL